MMIWAAVTHSFQSRIFTINDGGKKRRIQETDRGHVSRVVVYHYHNIAKLVWGNMDY
jgi:hypothetical protein